VALEALGWVQRTRMRFRGRIVDYSCVVASLYRAGVSHTELRATRKLGLVDLKSARSHNEGVVNSGLKFPDERSPLSPVSATVSSVPFSS